MKTRRDIDVHYTEHTVPATQPKHEAAGLKAVFVSLRRGLTSTPKPKSWLISESKRGTKKLS